MLLPSDTRLADVFSWDYLRALRNEDSGRIVVAFKLNGPHGFPRRVLVRMNRLARLRLVEKPEDEDSRELKLLTDPYMGKPPRS